MALICFALILQLVFLSRCAVLTNLSQGFVTEWQLSNTEASNVVFMGGLDGSLLPGDGKQSHNYMVVIDLNKNPDVEDLSNYQLKLNINGPPIIKEGFLWTSHNNKQIYLVAGQGINKNNIMSEGGLWTYDIATGNWSDDESVSPQPERVVGAVSVNDWVTSSYYLIGGYFSNLTAQFVTDTWNYRPDMECYYENNKSISHPGFPTPLGFVQNGVVSWWNYPDSTLLFYLGGESPSKTKVIPEDIKFTSNSWDHVWVYSQHLEKWYKQSTTGVTVPRRSYTCSVLVADESGVLYLWVFGGVDFTSHDVLDDVSYLVIPSFKWYKANPLPWNRMDMTCNTWLLNQALLFGGRGTWDSAHGVGSAKYPIAVYDLVAQSTTKYATTSTVSYVAPSTVTADLKTAFFPNSWDDAGFKSLMMSLAAPSYKKVTGNSIPGNQTGGLSSGAQIGIGVGVGVGGLFVIIGIIWLLLKRRRSRRGTVKSWRQDSESSPEDEMRGLDEKKGPFRFGTVHEVHPALEGSSRNPAEVSAANDIKEAENTAVGSVANPVLIDQSNERYEIPSADVQPSVEKPAEIDGRQRYEKASNEVMMGSEESPVEIDGAEIDASCLGDATELPRDSYDDIVSPVFSKDSPFLSRQATNESIDEGGPDGYNEKVGDDGARLRSSGPL